MKKTKKYIRNELLFFIIIIDKAFFQSENVFKWMTQHSSELLYLGAETFLPDSGKLIWHQNRHLFPPMLYFNHRGVGLTGGGGGGLMWYGHWAGHGQLGLSIRLRWLWRLLSSPGAESGQWWQGPPWAWPAQAVSPAQTPGCRGTHTWRHMLLAGVCFATTRVGVLVLRGIRCIPFFPSWKTHNLCRISAPLPSIAHTPRSLSSAKLLHKTNNLLQEMDCPPYQKVSLQVVE